MFRNILHCKVKPDEDVPHPGSPQVNIIVDGPPSGNALIKFFYVALGAHFFRKIHKWSRKMSRFCGSVCFWYVQAKR